MATQDDIYRESQKTAAEAAKTTAELQKVVQELAEARNNPTQDPEVLKLLEEQRDAAEAAGAAADEANAQAKKREEVERRLLGQSEKQYDEMLKQRSVTESSKKEMEDLEAVLGEDAKNNQQYQDAQARYNKEQAKSQKLESRRNLLSRFKDTKEEGGTGAAVKELGGTAIKGIGKTFKKIGGILGRFGKVFSILVIPALVLLVNSPVWGMLKENIKKLISWASSDDNFLFGKNGVIKLLVDKFGALEVGIAAVLGFFTLKALGFAGIKAIFVGMKVAGVAIVKALGVGLVALSSFFGIAVAPLVAIIAAIAAVGYAIVDTFLEVKKAFDEGASVPELIRVAIVNFYGAFGKILDFIKDLIADVLEFFGFEDVAKSFREFSFEKIIEDFLNSIMDGIDKLFDYDFSGMLMNMLAAVLPDPDSVVGKLLPAGVYALAGIDKETGEKLEDPEVRAKRLADAKAKEEAQEAKDKEVRRLQRELANVTEASTDADDEVKDLEKSSQREFSSGVFGIGGYSKEDKAEDLEDLKNERAKAAALEERRLALLEQLMAAQSAPVVVAPSSTVNEAPKTQNNVSTSASLKPTGTTGAVANGGGSMAMQGGG